MGRVDRQHPVGVRNGRLNPCSRFWNCVCSYDTEEPYAIAPIEFSGSAGEAMETLRSLVESQPRTRIVTSEDRYLHAEFRSRIFRFVDDVEFLIDETANAIHVRSASRIGLLDIGVNRSRVEKLRRQFAERAATGRPS